jgi:hypothetical protein
MDIPAAGKATRREWIGLGVIALPLPALFDGSHGAEPGPQ